MNPAVCRVLSGEAFASLGRDVGDGGSGRVLWGSGSDCIFLWAAGTETHRVWAPPRVSREGKSCGSSDDVTELNEGVWMDISHGGTETLVARLSRGWGGSRMESDPITEGGRASERAGSEARRRTDWGVRKSGQDW